MSGRLLHYSAAPLLSVDDRDHELYPDHKPQGLWFSVGEAWKDWCEAERFGLDRLLHVSPIVLGRGAKILRLRNPAALDKFTAAYRTPLLPGTDLRSFVIDWPKVSESYDGIVIAPYQWRRRLSIEAFWYYGWDCASGCIWRRRAVALIGNNKA